MTSIDIILEEIKDEKIKKIAKLAYQLGVQETKNLMLNVKEVKQEKRYL